MADPLPNAPVPTEIPQNPYGDALDLDAVNQASQLGGLPPVQAPVSAAPSVAPTMAPSPVVTSTVPSFLGRMRPTPLNRTLISETQDMADVAAGQRAAAEAKLAGGEQQLDMLKQKDAAMRPLVDEAAANHTDYHARRQQFQHTMDRELDELKASYDQYAQGAQPSKSSQIMAGIGGALMALGNGNAKVLGRQLVRGMQSGVERDTATIMRGLEAAKGKLGATQTAMKENDTSAMSAAHEAASAMNLAATPYLNALDQLKLQTNNEVERNLLDQVGFEMRNSIRDQYEKIYANDAKMNAARASQAQMALLGGLTDEQLRQQAMKGNQVAMKLYKERLGFVDKESEIAGQNAKAAKDAAEGGPQTMKLMGQQVTFDEPIDKPTTTEIAKNARAMASVIDNIEKLKAIRVKNKGGTTNDNDEIEAKRLMDENSGLLSNMTGKGAPSDSERKAIMESMVDPTGYYVGSMDPVKAYDTQIADTKRKFKKSIEIVGGRFGDTAPSGGKSGFKPLTDEAGASKPAPTVAPPAMIRMFNPETGEVIPSVHPANRKLLEGKGFVVGRPSDSTPDRTVDENPVDVEPSTPRVGASY